MGAYSPEHERVYVTREIIPEESQITVDPYFEQLREAIGNKFVNRLHVSVLTHSDIRNIGAKYPNDHPNDLIIEALGDLQLPAVQYAHIEEAEVFWGRNGSVDPCYYVASPLDSEGARRIHKDAAELLGYFGLKQAFGRTTRPHLSFVKMYDEQSYAQYLADNISKAVGEPKPIAVSHPVVEHRRLGERPGKPRFLLFDRLAIS